MNPLRSFLASFRSLFAGQRRQRELEDELRAHFEMLVEQNLQRGMTPEDARRAARMELGGADQIKEAVHDGRGFPLLDSIFSDFRYAARMLRKAPGFTTVAILTLALGIGANTAIFTMMNGLMLRTLPVRDPGQLVELLHQAPGEPEVGGFSWNAYQIMRGNHVFSDLFIGSTMNFGPVRADKLQPQTAFVGSVGGPFSKRSGCIPQPAA